MNQTSSDVRTRVRAAVGAVLQVDPDPTDDEVPLATRYERYDSLAVIDCVGSVEQEFGVSIDLVEDDLRTTFVSVASIEELVQRKLADQAVLRSAF